MAARKPKPKPEPDAELVDLDGDGYLVATVDLLIDRPDLGPAAATQVAAGDRIPGELIHHPRRRAA